MKETNVLTWKSSKGDLCAEVLETDTNKGIAKLLYKDQVFETKVDKDEMGVWIEAPTHPDFFCSEEDESIDNYIEMHPDFFQSFDIAIGSFQQKTRRFNVLRVL